MLNTLFHGIFDSTSVTAITVGQFLLCLATALAIGVFLAFIYTKCGHFTQSFVLTLSLLPAIVCVIILMVNGNVGAGVAVAGAFSLVRFRSAPGTARDIGTLFLAMASGLICGMGYLAYAVLFTVILGIAMFLFNHINFRHSSSPVLEKSLHITIPEDLDYCGVFDEIFEKYTSRHEIISVKTTNMGSLFKLTYNITIKNPADEKEFIDALRCRNGNLEISIARQEANIYEL